MGDPQVSVLLPVRDGARWIEAAVASILRQTLTALELIIVDDGSSDATPDVVAALAVADPRVKVLRQAPLGLVTALNRAIEAARAPLLARLDADDIALSDRLARQTARFDADDALVLLGSFAEKIDAEDRTIGTLRPETDPARLMTLLVDRNPFVHSTVMMRAAAVRHVGLYREACRHAEDYDLWLRLAEVGTVAILPEVLVRYRRHGGSVTRRRVLEQGFSARLARRAAAERRRIGIDPLEGLDRPPDWQSPDALPVAFREEARLYRFLAAGAQESGAERDHETLDLPSPQVFAALNHAEKALARRALRRLLRGPAPPTVSRFDLLGLFAHGLLGWRLLRRAGPDPAPDLTR
ncbi:MAG: glycosyltransferase family 2 protein [Labrys sp. (in: a-proteobacteria)]